MICIRSKDLCGKFLFVTLFQIVWNTKSLAKERLSDLFHSISVIFVQVIMQTNLRKLIWILLNFSGPFWTYLDLLNLSGPLWTYLDLLELIWILLNLFKLSKCGLKWSQKGLKRSKNVTKCWQKISKLELQMSPSRNRNFHTFTFLVFLFWRHKANIKLQAKHSFITSVINCKKKIHITDADIW